MTIGQEERRVGQRPPRRTCGGQVPETSLPEEARELLQRADRLVYLFPDGFDPSRLVADQTASGEPRVFDFELLVEPPAAPGSAPAPDAGARSVAAHTFVGHMGPRAFAVEVRARSATIVAELFAVRRDLLLVIKEYAERRAREEGGAKR